MNALFTLDNPGNFIQKAQHWASEFTQVCILDSNHYTDPYGQYDCLIAVGAFAECLSDGGPYLPRLKVFQQSHGHWLFGFLGYDLKNELEDLYSNNPDGLYFPDAAFFSPMYLLRIRGKQLEIDSQDPSLSPKALLNLIHAISPAKYESNSLTQSIHAKLPKENYLEKIRLIQSHINRGYIYEMTFCMEFFSHAQVNPFLLRDKLNKQSPTPFSGLLRIRDHYILCSSPERYLQKIGSKLISQPIKGTASVSPYAADNTLIKEKLRLNPKEQAENVMIVDLVRNDLSRCAERGSVQVDELFGVYSFRQVHQLISTVSAELKAELSPIDAIACSFPMGSMTGAPKIKAMQLIEELEESRRGAYSGALGYISPDGNFDFNVIIRSILYNSSNEYLSFQVGSAITAEAVPEQEYEECLVKAKAMIETLGY